ncbi:MAG: universal stress protein [Bacteroidota bacterium]|nr:universal stress protein [Bacteroidota bacterium]
MKKILIANDGAHFSEGAFQFAQRLNELSPLLLTGVFLPEEVYASIWSYSMTGPLYIPVMDAAGGNSAAAKEKFESLCVKHGIEYRVHHDYNDFGIAELKRETNYADLLVIGSESFYEQAGSTGINEYVDQTLHHAACPVVIVPEASNFPETNILAYDGSESAAYAIRQFALLLPELAANKTILLYAGQPGDTRIPDQEQMEEFASRHFPDLTIHIIHAGSNGTFTSWIANQKNALLVSGAFGRTIVSRLFRQSFISGVIADHRIPVFIAHR